MKIYYRNHLGQTVDFMEWPYKVAVSELFDYDWLYESRSSLNPKITRFYRNTVEKGVEIHIAARNLRDYNQALMELLEVTDRDVLSLTPGRLYVDDTYLVCYFKSSKKVNWYPGVPFLANVFTLVSETGKWINEVKASYSAGGQASATESYMDYAYDYAYDYSGSSGWVVLDNPGYAAADFVLTIHGSCEKPEVKIAGHTYSVDCTLAAGEYLRIDSQKRKVYKVRVNGEQVNQFNQRNRDSYIFQKIPEGNCVVSWDGSFALDILLYEERSEPRWT